jgi:hypothetical protein
MSCNRLVTCSNKKTTSRNAQSAGMWERNGQQAKPCIWWWAESQIQHNVPGYFNCGLLSSMCQNCIHKLRFYTSTCLYTTIILRCISTAECNSIWPPCSGLKTSIHISTLFSDGHCFNCCRDSVPRAMQIIRSFSTSKQYSLHNPHIKSSFAKSGLPGSYRIGHRTWKIVLYQSLHRYVKQWNCKHLIVMLHTWTCLVVLIITEREMFCHPVLLLMTPYLACDNPYNLPHSPKKLKNVPGFR